MTYTFHLWRVNGSTTTKVATVEVPISECGDDLSLVGDALVARLCCVFCNKDDDEFLYWTSPNRTSPADFDHTNHADIDPEIEDANNNHGQPDPFDYEWSGAD